MNRLDTLRTRTLIDIDEQQVTYYRLSRLEELGLCRLARLPYSIRVLLESVVRNENGETVHRDDVLNMARYEPTSPAEIEIPFVPARVILQDFTGVPSVVDLAAMRGAMEQLGGDPRRINPLVPVDLVIDHSVQVDYFASHTALELNARLEFQRNIERYQFLRWGQQAFERFRVVPPASGIVHQVNLEHLGQIMCSEESDGRTEAFSDTLVGTDSHTTMINGLGILGWGVGGIEAEAALLGQPMYLLLPAVVGVRLVNRLRPGVTATDLALTVTHVLRKHGVVGKFVEFFGPGLDHMSLPDRATIANMAPEYGATAGFFPTDAEALRYLRQTGRSERHVRFVERLCRAQALFRTSGAPDPEFAEVLALDLSGIEPSVAGPKRPQDRSALTGVKANFQAALTAPVEKNGYGLSQAAVSARATIGPSPQAIEIGHGAVVIAAITSCTNTSNPSVLLGAAILAKKAVERGLTPHPAVKTSFAPGSKAVTSYLTQSRLLPYLEQLGFHVVGYGCTTCIGNSGPLPDPVVAAVNDGRLVVASVLSGNRNFEGRINPHTRANYLASPPLVVAYAIAGTVDIDLTCEPLGVSTDGQPVFLSDIWPGEEEIAAYLPLAADPEQFSRAYSDLDSGNDTWNQLPVPQGALYAWDPASSYIQQPPFFQGMTIEPEPVAPIRQARVLVKVGDSVTTDHISPAGSIPTDSPAGQFLISQGVEPINFNSYGARRGNDQVMTRGTFGNVRLKNQLAPGTEGGVTLFLPTGEQLSIYAAAVRYQQLQIPTLILAGKDYGMGSSRDWAAKGILLLGVRAVIAESYERIHRANLVGMGVLPLEYLPGEHAESLGLTGHESFTIHIPQEFAPRQHIAVTAEHPNGSARQFSVVSRLDTPVDIAYFVHGGVLKFVLRKLLHSR